MNGDSLDGRLYHICCDQLIGEGDGSNLMWTYSGAGPLNPEIHISFFSSIFARSQLFTLSDNLMSTEPVSVHKIPRLDKEDDPLPDQMSFIPLKHQDEIKTEGATLRLV